MFDEPNQEVIDVDNIYQENVNVVLTSGFLTIWDFDYYVQNHPEVASQLYFEIPDSLLMIYIDL